MGFRAILLTDVVGSTALWERHGDHMATALEQHDRLIAAAIDSTGGRVFKHTGDGMIAVFDRVDDAVAGGLGLVEALATAQWGATGPIEVRVSVHAGHVVERDGDYFGPPLNRAARINGVAHAGQVLVSNTAHELMQPPRGLDLGSHQLRDLSDPVRLWQLDDGEHPPLRTLRPTRHNLPAMPTQFVGRTDELADVRSLVRSHRLVTIVGIGGCGKTRLAIEVAAASADQYPGGVWFVGLAVETDGAAVGTRALAALGLPDTSTETNEPARALAEAVSGSDTLIVLDNCEHLIDSAAEFAESILTGAPSITVLATSRESLSIDGERVWRIPNLRHGATELFVERATAAGADRDQLVGDLPLIDDICRTLDDIPLALELAASHAGSLPLNELHARLDDRFAMLDGSRRRGRRRRRQQTLRAVIDWSYQLLTTEERQLLKELAVFSGSFSIDGVEHVAAPTSTPVRTRLQALVEQSLVTPPARNGRYRLLETVRMYGFERLAEAGIVDAVRDRHLDWVVGSIGATAAAATDPGDGSTTMDHELRSIAEYENALTAMEWAAARERHDDVFDVFVGRAAVWPNVPSTARTGLDWLERIGKPPRSDPLRRAVWLQQCGHINFNLGDASRAVDAFLEGALLVDELRTGDPHWYFAWAPTIAFRAFIHAATGEHDAALADAELLDELAGRPGAHRPSINSGAWMARLLVYLQTNDPRQLHAAEQAFAALDGVSIWADGARSLLAGTLASVGRHREALDHAVACLESSVCSLYARSLSLETAAQSMVALGRVDDAVEVVATDPGPLLESQRQMMAKYQLAALGAIFRELGDSDRVRSLVTLSHHVVDDPFASFRTAVVTELLDEPEHVELPRPPEHELELGRITAVIDESVELARSRIG